MLARVPRYAAFLALLFIVFSDRPSSADAAPIPSRPMPESDGCELPPQGAAIVLTFPQVGSDGLFQIPAAAGQPHLVISCLEFDRSAYLEGENWGASLTVTNAGNAVSEAFTVYAQLCRHMSDGVAFSCTVGVFALASSEPPLAPQESRVINDAATHGFSALDPDPPGEYESWVEGFPDNGTVYLRASVAGLGEYVVASAIYPSGPNSLPPLPPGFVDADEDGYSGDSSLDSLQRDCNDANYLVHPNALEIVNDGVDNDCSAGDAAIIPCEQMHVIYNGQCLEQAPGESQFPSLLDLDSDGFSSDEGDCDDTNFNIHPGAVEILDGLDNNCNGLIDEAIGQPDFTLSATVEESTQSIPGYPALMAEGLAYNITVGNVGGAIEARMDSLQSVYVQQSVDAGGTEGILATGTQGFIPYSLMPSSRCSGGPLVFTFATNGVYGETNFGNNTATVTDFPVTGAPADLFIRFSEDPTVTYSDDTPAVSVFPHAEAVGSCPPPPGDLAGPESINRYRILVNGTTIYDETLQGLDYIASTTLPSRLRRLDRVCVEVTLDVPGLYPGGSPAFAGAYEYHTPVFAADELELVSSATGWAGEVSCTAWSAGGEFVGGALTSTASTTAGLLGGLGGGLFIGAVGALGAWWLGRRWLGGASPGLIAAGAAVGAVAGGLAGSALVGQLPRPTAAFPATAQEAFAAEAGRLSCDLFLDADSAVPAEAAEFRKGEALMLDLSPLPSIDSQPASFTLLVESPSGARMLVPWETDDSGDLPPLDIVGAAVAQRSQFFQERGRFHWSIARGTLQGAGLTCFSSTRRSFALMADEAPPAIAVTPTIEISVSPTITVSASPTLTRTLPPPTRTPTPSAAPDTTGPSIKSVSDSPDSIKVTQPKGCTPTTSTVSASITDPSGVKSAVVLFFHTTIGQVAMTHGSGNTWSATLGPYSATGDGTVDYQIRATDGQGNVSESGFGQVTVLACIP
ncbi:MAG TPA: putative metal-binding motif-containing protein [Anaerolineales bacterium]|nr:putative metal-binding motif-containing protein [Anaerolineales bacterium]